MGSGIAIAVVGVLFTLNGEQAADDLAMGIVTGQERLDLQSRANRNGTIGGVLTVVGVTALVTGALMFAFD